MDRMGHSSTRAALIYQHSSDERQRKLADAVGEAARAALQDSDIIWHARGTRARANRERLPPIGPMAPEQVFEIARPAGFEPATRCLEGIPEASQDVAKRRSTS